MKVKLLFGLVVATLGLMACNDYDAESGISNLVFENQSQCSITIDKSDNAPHIAVHGVVGSIALAAGESVQIENISTIFLCKAFGCVVYGDEVLLDFFAPNPYSSWDRTYSPYDITRVGNYKVTKISSSLSEYRYTFTDADYEFALENGTLLEQE